MKKLFGYSTEYQNAAELIRKLSILDNIEATKKLSAFYAKARFKITPDEFDRQNTDGANDGGIDFYNTEDNTFYIFQTKYAGKAKRVGSSEILNELKKIKNTIAGNNPNKKAADFVSQLKRQTGNKGATLEIIWLTTNIIEQSIIDEIQENLELWKKENNWSISIDFFAVDKYGLGNVIYDVQHGYIPYTGKKILKLEEGQWMENISMDTGIHSVVCTLNVNDILTWFKAEDDIDKYLQKNVREFLGEGGKINKCIGKSYLESPMWFWYKHNGIIIFVDTLSIDDIKRELVIRNPQVVNGGQTLKDLFLT